MDFGGEGFAANPAGQGAAAAELYEDVAHLPLPNIELAGSEIREIDDTPSPALVGPIPMDNSERIALAFKMPSAGAFNEMLKEYLEDSSIATNFSHICGGKSIGHDHFKRVKQLWEQKLLEKEKALEGCSGQIFPFLCSLRKINKDRHVKS